MSDPFERPTDQWGLVFYSSGLYRRAHTRQEWAQTELSPFCPASRPWPTACSPPPRRIAYRPRPCRVS
jgi:hypothetical protein